jgi:solute:Na+ symporter, SSS family
MQRRRVGKRRSPLLSFALIVTIAQAPLRPFDLAVIIAYLAGVTWFGARFKSGQRSLKDYFLGGRNAPWWAIGLSIVSAETSTLTIIGTPPLAYAGSYVFLQVVFGYLLARIVISVIFLPQYFKGQMFTAYELMQRRFGPRVRKVTAAIFLVTHRLPRACASSRFPS